MKFKASEFLSIQIDHLEDISRNLKKLVGRLSNTEWDNVAIEIIREIETVEQNLNQFCIVMIQKEQERQKGSEL